MIARYPVWTPEVEEELDHLLKCIDMSPHDGPLFTSQAPFFAVVMAGLLSHKQEQRRIVREWFIPVVTGARGVSGSA